MRKYRLTAILLLCALLFSGCSQYDQVENIAYAVMIGLELSDGGAFEISAAIPKVSGGRESKESGGSSGSGQLIFSASGSSFSDALSKLHWAVPRRLELSQVELVVVSEALARSERFRESGKSMIDQLYGAANIAVCSGSAKEFLQAQEPLLGSRTSSELTAMLEDYTRSGFIPDSTLADFFYRTSSVYSDPLTILAAPAPESETVPAALMLPDSIESTDEEMQGANRFFGAAVFRKGVMVGTLDGRQMLLCKLLRGEHQTFSYSLGTQSAQLSTLGLPRIQADVRQTPVALEITMDFSVLPGSNAIDPALLSEALREDLLGVIDHCRQMGAEPFLFAEKTVRSFSTLSEWTTWDWPQRFAECDVRIKVRLHSEHS